MMSTKQIVATLSLVGLLNACAAPTQITQSSQSVGNVANCPKEPASLPITVSTPKEGETFYDRFDYQIRNIVANADTVKFQTPNYDFVFCRGNKSWTVSSGTLPAELQPKTGADYYKELENPPYKTIDFNGETYQYRVILTPNPFPSNGQPVEPQQAIFELIPPNSQQPQRQTLYTLSDLTQANLGISLGVPRVTSAINYNNRLFFAVAFEQGEGASGIATIVSYDSEKNESIIIQPPEIRRQQITDLVISGDSANPTLWMGTETSGEGNPYLPGMGLVAYRPNPQNLKSGSVKFYTVNNSPIVGAIPNKLKLENDTLWVGTGNGICQVKWQSIDNYNSWSCGRFALFTQLPTEGVPLYKSSGSKNRETTFKSDKPVEVLWFSPIDFQTRKGRYEVRYSEGFTVNLDKQGVEAVSPDITKIREEIQPGNPPFDWPGSGWHWNGARFVRGFDEVGLNLVGGGPSGIGSDELDPNTGRDLNALRGDFDLLNLSKTSTSVKYYSGWVDEDKVNLSLTVVPYELPKNTQPNPLTSFANQL
ncbi:MAG TPA: hypothetical protein V6D33_00165 [Cyanophyceae cyanobacterium]